MGGTFGTYGCRRCAYRVLTGKPERIVPPVRPRITLEDNIKTDLKAICWGDICCVCLGVGIRGGLL